MQHGPERHMVQVGKQLVLVPQDVEIGDPPLRAPKVLLQCCVVF